MLLAVVRSSDLSSQAGQLPVCVYEILCTLNVYVCGGIGGLKVTGFK